MKITDLDEAKQILQLSFEDDNFENIVNQYDYLLTECKDKKKTSNDDYFVKKEQNIEQAFNFFCLPLLFEDENQAENTDIDITFI